MPTQPVTRSPERDRLLEKLEALRAEMTSSACLAPLHDRPLDPSYRQSAENLLHYLCLRRHDLRDLQMHLAQLGLSSLGRCEPATLAAVDSVIAALRGLNHDAPAALTHALTLSEGERLLDAHAEALFGPITDERPVRIMVTLPSESARDDRLIEDLVKGGMDCARINCVHDDPPTWQAMIERVRAAEKSVGRSCRITLDLAGPKLRTGPIATARGVVKVRPTRDAYGRVQRPARICLAWQAHDAIGPEVQASLPIVGGEPADFSPGDVLKLRDARGAKRRLTVVAVEDSFVLAELHKTAYFTEGLRLKHRRAGKTRRHLTIGELPPREQKLVLAVGDRLLLTGSKTPVDPTDFDTQQGKPARIGCTLPQVLPAIRTGDSVWFDDGKIGARVDKAGEDQLQLRVTHVAHASGRAKLASDKGINFPDSPLPLSAPTDEDLDALAFAARHADIVEMSFANRAQDVETLLEHLERLDAGHLGVVLKIETRTGFENLPAMLLAGMHRPRFGVMIARGDLAVESGFERLAEVQEEMLCLCQAAHVPVIWATQVLENLAKSGAPSRSEITDAAMGVRAECVMLNKGPYILKALSSLDDVLRRMQGHRSKKRDLFRPLRVAALAGSNEAPDSRKR
ncbi:pyruvate kinase [Stutzerimonas urumqiensis]|uniref:pyruvate kinase n=1 Tax=Stutzerimonas urumqiensis TaxID=638269 RepID=UPI003BACAED1